ncbi:MAG: recombinase family protein [Acidobacteria bacterium]|nr:recombinase family protein [Acidobacteriota bacterium]
MTTWKPKTLAEEVSDLARTVRLADAPLRDVERLVELRHRLAATPGETTAERRARSRALYAASRALARFIKTVEAARLVVAGNAVRPRRVPPGPRPRLGRGRVPYGSTLKAGQLVPHEAERKVIERVILWRSARLESFAKIAARLEAEGIPSPGGVGAWSASAVQRILLRERPELGRGDRLKIARWLARRRDREESGRSGYGPQPGRSGRKPAPSAVTPPRDEDPPG